uniref:Uncharacterized protein n=1 Tax=Aegilops tauschii subsp. strangulata TaxID=200361 RepID=A0A453EFG9_AEGTS
AVSPLCSPASRRLRPRCHPPAPAAPLRTSPALPPDWVRGSQFPLATSDLVAVHPFRPHACAPHQRSPPWSNPIGDVIPPLQIEVVGVGGRRDAGWCRSDLQCVAMEQIEHMCR